MPTRTPSATDQRDRAAAVPLDAAVELQLQQHGLHHAGADAGTARELVGADRARPQQGDDFLTVVRGLVRLGPGVVSMLGMMSPGTAVLLGWFLLGQELSPVQMIGAVIVLGSIWAGQHAATQPRLKVPAH